MSSMVLKSKFRKDLMIKIESMNFVSVDFNNEDIFRGEYYGDRKEFKSTN